MSVFDTFVAKRQTLTDFCNHRAGIVKLLTEHDAHFQLIQAEMKKFYQYGMPRSSEPLGRLEESIKELDRMYWRQSFDHTGLMQLLDAQSKKKFDRDLQENPPEFTIENVQSSFIDLSQNAEKMFEDGVVNVFHRLSNRYMTNDGFRIGDKVVMTWMVEPSFRRGLQLRHGQGEDEINDIDRVFKTFDGKRYVERSLSCAMNTAIQDGGRYEDDYFAAKAFKNGNLHLKFKRADLVERVNLVIAKRYGATIGDRTD